MSIGQAVGVGDSWLHRAAARWKLLALLVFSAVLMALRSPLTLAVAAALVVLAYASTGLPHWGMGALWRQLRPLRWFVVFLVPFHVLTAGWRTMVEVVGLMVVTVAAAGLVTETTRLADMLETLTAAIRPLRHVGIDPQRPALVLALTVRAIPVIAQIAGQSMEARKARGLERSVKALVTPVVIRTIRHAERTGESLTARGFDD